MLALCAAVRSPGALTQTEQCWQCRLGAAGECPESSPLPSALCWAGSVLLMLGVGFVAGEGGSSLLRLHLLPLCLFWAFFGVVLPGFEGLTALWL